MPNPFWNRARSFHPKIRTLEPGARTAGGALCLARGDVPQAEHAAAETRLPRKGCRGSQPTTDGETPGSRRLLGVALKSVSKARPKPGSQCLGVLSIRHSAGSRSCHLPRPAAALCRRPRATTAWLSAGTLQQSAESSPEQVRPSRGSEPVGSPTSTICISSVWQHAPGAQVPEPVFLIKDRPSVPLTRTSLSSKASPWVTTSTQGRCGTCTSQVGISLLSGWQARWILQLCCQSFLTRFACGLGRGASLLGSPAAPGSSRISGVLGMPKAGCALTVAAARGASEGELDSQPKHSAQAATGDAS